ncbi:MAG TPA: hypothetical protein DGG95_06875 [Cytophagales bacterium]|jgi:hypothetical protein|nr:hypothetical protein [Cytophagales bacterium]
MKKILPVVLLVLISEVSFACEICGCANNNFQIGLLPNFRKYFIGFRYSGAHYHSQLSNDPTQFSNDYYHSYEMWGGYQFKKVQVMAFLPFLNSTKVSDDGTVRSSGLGDFILMANYRIYTKMKMDEAATRTMKNELWLGGGIKLPTGINKVNVMQADFNIGDFNSQPGTGSVDYLFNATHNILWNNSGVVTNATYRLNTTNAQQYHFGNRVYISSSYFQTFNVQKVKVRPMVGVSYLRNSVNVYEGNSVQGSDGYTFSGIAGVNLIFGKLGIMTNTYLPVSQNMYNNQTQLQSKSTIGLTFSL